MNVNIRDISLKVLDKKLSELEAILLELRELEKTKRELIRIQEVVLFYEELLPFKNTVMDTEQKKRLISFIEKYPFLSLYKGREGIELFCSAYQDEVSLQSYAQRSEVGLVNGGYAERMSGILKPYLPKAEDKNLP